MEEQQTLISYFRYSETEFEEKDNIKLSELSALMAKPGIKWFNIDGTDEAQVIEQFSQHFSLHPLLVEDIIYGHARAKMEDYDEHLFIVLNTLKYDTTVQVIIKEQVSLVLGPDYVLSFQEVDKLGDVFDPVRINIRNHKGKTRKNKSDYLLYSLMDTVIDNYFIILEHLGEKLENYESDLSADTSMANLRSIYRLKNQVQELRKSVWPLRELLVKLERDECELIQSYTRPYMRDLYDHVIQVIDGAETFRENLTSMLDLQLSVSGMKMNNIMKVLTVISTIFMPLTFIVGVYGMNFDNMPELKMQYAYFVVLGGCAVITIGMIFYFRKKKWL